MTEKKRTSRIIEKLMKTEKHPSYGCVQVSRVSGQRELVGSATKHYNFIEITVCEAAIRPEEDDHAGQVVSTRQAIVSFGMTEHQFAQMIMSFNQSEGTPCTLLRRPDPEANIKLVSCSPPPKTRSLKDNFSYIVDDVAESLQEDTKQYTAELREIVNGRLTKKQQERFELVLSVLENNLASNLKFGVTRLHEVAEKKLGRVKVEVEAHSKRILNSMGLGSIKERVRDFLPEFGEEE